MLKSPSCAACCASRSACSGWGVGVKVGVGRGVAVAVGLGRTVGVAESAGVAAGAGVFVITGVGVRFDETLHATNAINMARAKKSAFMRVIIAEAARCVNVANTRAG